MNKMDAIKKIIRMIEWEALAWIIALVYLAFINPYQDSHFTLCPYKNLGFDFCPGCGLGKSISLFYRGDLLHSFQTHPMGMVAFIIIVFRIVQLIKRKYLSNKHREVIYG